MLVGFIANWYVLFFSFLKYKIQSYRSINDLARRACATPMVKPVPRLPLARSL